MAAYSILVKDSVRKDLDGIPGKELKRIIERIGGLADNPRPAGCERLTGQERYRIRQGNYRIVYSIQDTELTVWVIKVGQRREVYR
jgi:mRNA interferase RelE/StbE